MAEELTIPTWRQALSERSHPLYEAAWVIFKMHSVDFASELLEENKEAVISLIKEILESDELYINDGFGSGQAPVNAIRLIGHWKLEEFLPQLLEIIADTPEQRPAYGAALNAVANLGESVIDAVLAWVEEDESLRPDAAKILQRVGLNNDKAFDAIQSWIDINDPQMVSTYTNYLISINPARAEYVIDDLSRNRDLDKGLRKQLKNKVNEARQRQQALKELEASATKAAEELVEAAETLQPSSEEDDTPEANTEEEAE
ncbi:MAG: hypothetical protein CUN55_02450 [Phototrophicales bacterium]|nr:MAG: hypothetical protein CUN55_02450 [Phototrophicales bacterium]